MSMQLQTQVKAEAMPTPAHATILQRKCGDCSKKKLVMQRSALDNAEPAGVPPLVHEVLNSPGQPLDTGTRAFMEPRFGHDFSRVRVHSDTKADESARSVGALAYTVGQDLVFSAGQNAPGTSVGERLLAHELTHVVQQSRQRRLQAKLRIGAPGDIYEQEADRVADAVMRMPQAKATSDSISEVNPDLESNKQSLKGGGKPLSENERSLPFSSTMEIHLRSLKSREFHVSKGSVIVLVKANWSYPSHPLHEGYCKDNPYNIELTKKEMVIDQHYGDCDFTPDHLEIRTWTRLPEGDYYLTISRYNDDPYCCLTGTISVSEQSGLSDFDDCTSFPDDTLELLHTALDAAGVIPALFIIPDVINAGLYLIEGDWINAGITAAAMIPIFGDGANITRLGVRVTRKAVNRVGKYRIMKGVKKAQATGKIAELNKVNLTMENMDEFVYPEFVTSRETFKPMYKELQDANFQRKDFNAIMPDEKKFPTVELRPNGDMFGQYDQLAPYLIKTELTSIRHLSKSSIEAHHLLEDTFMGKFGIPQAKGRCVALEAKDHINISIGIEFYLPKKTFYDINDVFDAHAQVYREAGHPEWIDEIKDFLKKNKEVILDKYNGKDLIKGSTEKEFKERKNKALTFLNSL